MVVKSSEEGRSVTKSWIDEKWKEFPCWRVKGGFGLGTYGIGVDIVRDGSTPTYEDHP